MVFFTGTLQEGIASALQESKLVICFVTDDQEESKLWESEYLADETIAATLDKDAVLLRLEAGSQDAGYLAAIFPVPKYPTLVIIKDGKLNAYISTGTSKDEFLNKVKTAFSAQSALLAQGSSSAANSAAVSRPETSGTIPSDHPTPSSSGTNLASPVPEQSQGLTQAQLLAEAERRRQAARIERDKIDQERRRKDKGKMPATQDAKQDDTVKKASQQLAERQRKAREEKARVLKLIEDDKAERRARLERQRAERQAGTGGDGEQATVPGIVAPSNSLGRRHDQCAIQVRLFDGSTIRTRFPTKATVSQDVRKWIDQSRSDGTDPYTLKVILTPLPNKAIDNAAEEDQTLEELDLAPSSTLVLTPVDRYSSAYTNMNAGLTNPVSKLFIAVLAIAMKILGGIAVVLTGVGERNRPGPTTGEQDQSGRSRAGSQVQAAASGRDASGRIQGFQNADDVKRDHQLYNGNSLNFEPRNDDEDKDT
ncbi:unnamed protein product [Discula destructiva]